METMEAGKVITADEDHACYFTDINDNVIEFDDYGLPLEAPDLYSDAPLEFEELAEGIWEILTDTYISAASFNKLSPHYISLCAHLEKNIKQMGSLCVTKAVLEQKDMRFPKLEGMTVAELYTMVSLNFRKCRAAYQEIRDSGKGTDLERMDWVCRWGLLAEKLKATEVKIQKIRSGRISADSLIEQSRAFRNEPREKHGERDKKGIGKTASLPLLRSYAWELVKKKKQELAAKARAEREAEKAHIPGGFQPPRRFGPDKEMLAEYGNKKRDARQAQAKQEKPAAADEEDRYVTVKEMRKRIRAELAEKQIGYLSSDPGSGPSDTVRKKLREKRKKRKR